MSKFDLRDISERLTRSSDTEAVVFEFLGYLQGVQPDWRASLAFYEVSRDALVNIYERQDDRLIRRDISVPVVHLPARMVRKFFHPSSFFNFTDPLSKVSHLFHASPYYEPDTIEAPAMRGLVPVANWQSCVCMPLADHQDLIAMLVLASEKRHAFGSKELESIIPLKSIAALALAQHLDRAARTGLDLGDEGTARMAAAEFQERMRRLSAHARELEAENRAKVEELAGLGRELQLLDKDSSEYKRELERVKGTITILEQQTAAATEHLSEAYNQLDLSQSRIQGLERTLGFLKEVFRILSQEHEPKHFTKTIVSWLCEHFAVDRCSLMLLDGGGETLRIAAQQGIDPKIAKGVKVRVGQGIAGWVAQNRKPLFVRLADEAPLPGRDRESYNSDSFISAPLIFNNRVCGVLNLSNKMDGEAFDEADLDRALLVGSVLAVTLGNREMARRTAAWA